MPEKEKTYLSVIFTPEVIKQAVDVMETTLLEKHRKLTNTTLAIAKSD